jgi:DMSO/TMAO reductase YedYZ molybdopterin-dependent catalytic subunit
MNKLLRLTLLLLLLSACSADPPNPTPTLAATVTTTLAPTSTPTQQAAAQQPTQASQTCNLQPIVVPTRPAKIPPTNQLDETTGLHMTGDVQQLDLATYRLKVSGMVDHPLSLTLDDLRCLPKVTASPELICGDLFRDSATWSGVPIEEILNLDGVQAGAETVVLAGADGYTASITLEEALKRQNYLAYEWEGQPVPILHGFPLRAVFPDLGGSVWVKWLVGVVVN